MPKTADRPPLTVVSSTTNLPQPPRKFGAAGTAFWNQVQGEYAVDDAAGREILAQACTTVDRLAELRAAIERDGEVYYLRNMPKVHPALKTEMAERHSLTRLLAALGIVFEPLKTAGGQPRPVGWTGAS
jgi:hypothetical protein